MNKVKQYWKEGLIALLVIFSLNKCTQSCNRANEIDKQKIEIFEKDSILKLKSDSLYVLNIRWSDAKNNQSTYQGIALNTKQTLIDSINILKKDKNTLIDKIKKVELENNNLKKENKQLKDQIK